MSSEIIVQDSKDVSDIKVSSHSIEAMSERIQLMKKFVTSQLKESMDGDYAKIPGTPKKSLLKPGAEKLLLLFKLGFKFTIINQVIDLIIGEISFMTKCEVYRKEDGVVVGEYIAFCSNKEKKYKNQTPADIVNTILKMSEKRALVGATISATGASDYFTQDMEEQEAKKEVDSSRFTAKPVNEHGSYVVPIGKFKDMKLSDIKRDDLISYCQYVIEKNPSIEGKLKEFIDTAREFLRAA